MTPSYIMWAGITFGRKKGDTPKHALATLKEALAYTGNSGLHKYGSCSIREYETLGIDLVDVRDAHEQCLGFGIRVRSFREGHAQLPRARLLLLLLGVSGKPRVWVQYVPVSERYPRPILACEDS